MPELGPWNQQPQSWAVQWLLSRRTTDEQVAVLTVATETLDEVQETHEERRKELTADFNARLDAIVQMVITSTSDQAAQTATREELMKSAQTAYDKAMARIDLRSAAVQDVQRVIVRR